MAVSIYPDECTGCRICETVCAYVNEKVINPSKSRIKIVKKEEEGSDFPCVCMQCLNAPCVDICPTAALLRNEDGIINVVEDKCVGCKLCLMVCPYGAISLEGNTIIKCNLCDGEPACVDVCPTDALKLEDIEQISSTLRHMAANRYLTAKEERGLEE